MTAFADLVAATDRAVQAHLGRVSVTYQPSVGGPVTVWGMFDSNYTLIDPQHAGVEQVGPAVFFRLSDLPVHPDLDDPLLTIAGDAYRVRERRTDGAPGGGIVLLLHRV